MSLCYFRCFVFIFLVSFLSIFCDRLALAITIDRLEGTQTVLATGAGDTDSSVVSLTSSLGGTRALVATVANGTNILASVASGVFSHSQNVLTTGTSSIIWDGDSNPTNLNPTGLGGIDLTKDSADAFRLRIEAFDLPAGKSVELILTIYDVSDPSGLSYSQGALLLDSEVLSPEIHEIPFASLIASGPNGGANIKSVGALSLTVNGMHPAVDFSLGLIATNGFCTHVPVEGNVLDACGVCGGDNSTCRDCAGIPNGPALPGTMCANGELGVCGEGIYDSECSCISQQTPIKEICNNLDDDCDGTVDEGLRDRCNVCDGDGTSCLECNTSEISSTLAELDAGAKLQERIIKSAIKSFKATPAARGQENFIKNTLKAAHTLQIRNWVLSWTLPSISTVCKNKVFCTSSSNAPVLDEYRQHAQGLRELTQRVLDKIKTTKPRLLTRKKTLQHEAEKQLKANLALADTVPAVQSVCTQ